MMLGTTNIKSNFEYRQREADHHIAILCHGLEGQNAQKTGQKAKLKLYCSSVICIPFYRRMSTLT